jgi:ribA/ribD-fused uncharacterized protein
MRNAETELDFLDLTIKTWVPGEGVLAFCKAAGKNAFLSNMSEELPFRFPETTIGGVTIGPLEDVSTVEHVFQAFKAALAGYEKKKDKILTSAKPESCKAATSRRAMAMGEDQLRRWNALSPEVMLAVVRAKFADPANAARLRETGAATLVEQLQRFADDKWGVNRKGVGRNLLGQILMHVRGGFEEDA